MNSTGIYLRLTTFGESHGVAMGGVLDGFPPGVRIDFDALQAFVDTRRPGRPGTTTRSEKDRVEILSGFSPEGLTLGSPIGFMVRNTDCRSGDYDRMRDTYRPNHADYTTECRYGIRDHRGGGRASARETLCRVVAGALALQWLATRGVSVESRLVAVGGKDVSHYADPEALLADIEAARSAGDSVGGVVECRIQGMAAGIGNPVYDKFSARLAAAMISINAAMGFEYGAGFAAASMCGSDMADEFVSDAQGGVSTLSNNCGGIQGGITNGNDIVCRVAFKPTPTIARRLRTVTRQCRETTLVSTGRHDPCVALRAVPVVTAMAALTAADFLIGHEGTGAGHSAPSNPML